MATYPLALPYLRLTVNGVDRTARGELIASTLSVRSVLGDQIDTCSFSLKAPESWRPTASPGKPTVGQSVKVELANGTGAAYDIIFGGTVSSATDARVGVNVVRWDIQCVDYTSLLARILVTKLYVGWTISDIVRDVVRQFAPEVIVDANVQDCPTVLNRVAYSFQYPIDIIRGLAEIAGYAWYVDPARVLHFYDPAAASRVSPLSITDTSNNFYDLSIAPQLDQVRNRVVVIGGLAESQPVLETWDATGLEQGRFELKHRNVTGNLAPSGLTPFMTINGAEQITILDSYDAALYPGCFVLDSVNGRVRPGGPDTNSPVEGDHVEFRYRYGIPVSVLREDLDSQATVAALEGKDYATLVLADNPIFYWRLGETTGGTAANSGTAGVAYSGAFSSQTIRGVPGALQADSNPGVDLGNGGRIVCVSGAQVPRAAGAFEAWVKVGLEQIGSFGDGGPAFRELGIVGSWDTLRGGAAGGGGGAMLWLTSGGTFGLGYNGGGVSITNNEHLLTVNASGQPSGGGRYDHVFAGWDNVAGVRRLWVNNVLVGQDNFFQPHGLTGSGIEIGNYDYSRGLSQRIAAAACVDEVAVYAYLPSGTQVSAHYNAGRYAGVREAVINDPQIKSFDQARQRADAELAKWAAVITNVSFSSFVQGWQLGDSVPVALTASGSGRVYAASALIQQLETRFLGNQRPQYVVSCESTRFNFIDYQRQLLRQGDVITGNAEVIQVMRAIEATDAILIPGSVTASGAIPPFRIAPDWDTGGMTTHPSARVGYSLVYSG